MRALREAVAVDAPAGFALATITTYFLEQGPRGAAELALRFSIPTLVISGLTLEKLVVLRLDRGALDSTAKTIAFGWQPLQTRGLPNFGGTIRAIEQTDCACRVEIAGSYLAPGGTIGRLFDSVIGVRIARATIITLLQTFRSTIENDYAARRNP